MKRGAGELNMKTDRVKSQEDKGVDQQRGHSLNEG